MSSLRRRLRSSMPDSTEKPPCNNMYLNLGEGAQSRPVNKYKKINCWERAKKRWLMEGSRRKERKTLGWEHIGTTLLWIKR